MFKVKIKKIDPEDYYIVYSIDKTYNVRDESWDTEFLIYNDGIWEWINAGDCKPV